MRQDEQHLHQICVAAMPEQSAAQGMRDSKNGTNPKTSKIASTIADFAIRVPVNFAAGESHRGKIHP